MAALSMDERFRQYLMTFMKKMRPRDQRVSLNPLPGDGSHRIFWRVNAAETEQSFIAMANPPITKERERENNAYVMIGRHLRQKGISLPAIYQCNLTEGWFIIEDLGSVSLQDLVLSGKEPVSLYSKLLEHLFRLQTLGREGFDPSWCAQTERYDRTVMLKYEGHYFRDAFLKGFLGFDEPLAELDTAFDHLAEKASMADSNFFMHRDFQSRNIMVDGDKVGIIDWQGGRLGPLAYDLASLLLDPYVRLSVDQRTKIYEVYIALLKNYDPKMVGPFERDFPYLALQRNLQILGAFSFLSRVKKKTQFAAYIPQALKTLVSTIHDLGDHNLKPIEKLISTINLPSNL